MYSITSFLFFFCLGRILCEVTMFLIMQYRYRLLHIGEVGNDVAL